MKPKVKRSPNPAARALQSDEFRQRIVKAKKAVYSRKNKHKEGKPSKDGFPFFDSGVSLSAILVHQSHTCEEKLTGEGAKQ